MFLTIVGKSSTGKDSVITRLLERHPDAVKLVRETSRPIRAGEIPGKEYNYHSRSEFLQMDEEGKLCEHHVFYATNNGATQDWHYGTKKFQRNENGLTVCVGDLEMAKDLMDYCSEIGESFECVLMEVPDDIRRKRQSTRSGAYSDEEWNRRIAAEAKVYSEDRISKVCTKRVVNDGRFTIDQIADFCYQVGMMANLEGDFVTETVPEEGETVGL